MWGQTKTVFKTLRFPTNDLFSLSSQQEVLHCKEATLIPQKAWDPGNRNQGFPHLLEVRKFPRWWPMLWKHSHAEDSRAAVQDWGGKSEGVRKEESKEKGSYRESGSLGHVLLKSVGNGAVSLKPWATEKIQTMFHSRKYKKKLDNKVKVITVPYLTSPQTLCQQAQ